MEKNEGKRNKDKTGGENQGNLHQERCESTGENVNMVLDSKKGETRISPNLFSILVADVQEEPKKGRIGGVQVEKERIWSLAYADDLVLLAKNKERMKKIMKRMEQYLKRKKLLNTEK